MGPAGWNDDEVNSIIRDKCAFSKGPCKYKQNPPSEEIACSY
jgi:hypothetical protein